MIADIRLLGAASNHEAEARGPRLIESVTVTQPKPGRKWKWDLDALCQDRLLWEVVDLCLPPVHDREGRYRDAVFAALKVLRNASKARGLRVPPLAELKWVARQPQVLAAAGRRRAQAACERE